MESCPLASFRELFVSVHVREEDSLEQVVETVLAHPEAHDLCVVDDDEYLLGVINIKKLFRTLFAHHADPNLMVRHLLELVGSETAGHLMVTDPQSALETDNLGDAIKKMVRNNLGEIPVVTEEGKLLGSVSMGLVFDLWLQGRDVGEDSDF